MHLKQSFGRETVNCSVSVAAGYPDIIHEQSTQPQTIYKKMKQS
jgi:hypothetical protein